MTAEIVQGNGRWSHSENRLAQHVLRQLGESLAPTGPAGRLWIGFLLAVMLAGLSAYVWQCVNGLKVTAMREYISWGVYMTNFVFFIGVSHAGTLISAILRVTNAEWRRSITRMAEAITVFALMVGAPMVIIDMGRPDRIVNVLIHGRLNSPILWDVCSICTYISGSVLYLYVAMIPDFAMLAPPTPVWERLTWRQRLYRCLALGYRGTPSQRRFLEKALATMAVIIIPVAVSVHTVVSWIFGMTLRPGWHSTIFGPYFVIGAIFSGTAAIITAMAVFRKIYHLEHFLTERQFQNLGRLMLALNLLYIYFTLSEYLTTWYGSETAEDRLIHVLMGRSLYGLAFWSWAVFCLFLPLVIVMYPKRQNLIARLVVASILINIGMWIKRYLIIVPTLLSPYIPPEAAGVAPSYFPTWVEWTVTAGGLATFLLLFTLFAKLFPIVSIWETVEGVEELGAQNIGVDLVLPKETRQLSRLHSAPALLFAALIFAPSVMSLAGGELSKPVSCSEHLNQSGQLDARHSTLEVGRANLDLRRANSERRTANVEQRTSNSEQRTANSEQGTLNVERSVEGDVPRDPAANSPADAAVKPVPVIVLSSTVEDEERVLVATIKLESKPLKGAEVNFFAERLFGRLALGTATTAQDGRAVVSFPVDLPANTIGELRLEAEIAAPPEYASVRGRLICEPGLNASSRENLFPRALWSPKAPWGVVLTIFTLLSIVWSTYAFVIRQLIQIRRTT